MKNSIFTRPEHENEVDEERGKMYYLVLHNDDVHTFDYVIACLIDICGHDTVQAEQCTYLVHYKGSCDIMKGGYKQLVPFRKALAAKELKVTID